MYMHVGCMGNCISKIHSFPVNPVMLRQAVTTMARYRVRVVPVLSDNYAYLLICNTTKKAAAIDTAEAGKVMDAVKEEGCELTHLLTTHHHWDHTGGNIALKEAFPDLKVVGSDDRTPGITTKVAHGEVVQVGDLDVHVLFTPCHTRGHCMYHVAKKEQDGGALFTGDTIFVGGCGRFFEGDAKDMDRVVRTVNASVKEDDTLVFCGHEYTLSNLKFAVSVDGDNPALRAYVKEAQQKRDQGVPTVPSTLGLERKINPFMRYTVPSLQQYVGHVGDDVGTLRALRELKNSFYSILPLSRSNCPLNVAICPRNLASC